MPRWFDSAVRPVAWGLVLGLSAGNAVAADNARPPKLLNAAEARPVDHTEVIRERYPNRALRIERHVAQDVEGNYFNHGSWKMWDQQGQLSGTGQFRNGQRHGRWERYYKAGEAELISGPIGRQFAAPFTSEATFVNGQLDGEWTMIDAQKRPVISWHYADGQRHGQSVWWFPNGHKWREVEYRNGEVDGAFTEWNPQNQVVASEQYFDGHRLGTKTDWYEPGKKKIEAQYLFAQEITRLDENWWAGYSRLEKTGEQGQDIRQGRTVTYYSNGQKAMQANYRADKPNGTFVWWRSNGQKAIEGQYTDGKQTGTWAWWYANGQKWIQGNYQVGMQIGRWTWWTDAGSVIEAADFVDEDPHQPDAHDRETAEAPAGPAAPLPGSRKASFSQPAVSAARARQAN